MGDQVFADFPYGIIINNNVWNKPRYFIENGRSFHIL